MEKSLAIWFLSTGRVTPYRSKNMRWEEQKNMNEWIFINGAAEYLQEREKDSIAKALPNAAVMKRRTLWTVGMK